MKLWRGQPDHNNWRKPFNNREKANVWFGFSMMFIMLALSEWYSPKVPPFSGRYSWLFSYLYQINSDLGIISFYILIALACFIFGTSKWFEK